MQNLLYSVFYRTSRSVALDAIGNLIAAPGDCETVPQPGGQATAMFDFPRHGARFPAAD